MDWLNRVAETEFLCLVPQLSFSANSVLITKERKHSVSETAQRFELAVNENRRTAGWCLLKLITRQRQKKTDGSCDPGQSSCIVIQRSAQPVC